MKYFIQMGLAICTVLLVCFSCKEQTEESETQENVNPLPKKEYLGYVDTRIGTAPSIADITVTEVEEPLGYVSPIVGNPSANYSSSALLVRSRKDSRI